LTLVGTLRYGITTLVPIAVFAGGYLSHPRIPLPDVIVLVTIMGSLVSPITALISDIDHVVDLWHSLAVAVGSLANIPVAPTPGGATGCGTRRRDDSP
jgi:hypothetical protein